MGSCWKILHKRDVCKRKIVVETSHQNWKMVLWKQHLLALKFCFKIKIWNVCQSGIKFSLYSLLINKL